MNEAKEMVGTSLTIKMQAPSNKYLSKEQTVWGSIAVQPGETHQEALENLTSQLMQSLERSATVREGLDAIINANTFFKG